MSAPATQQFRVLNGLVLVPSMGLLIGVACAIISARVGGGMGWDELANGLGGFMAGGIGGMALAFYLATKLSPGRLRGVTIACGLLALGLIAYVIMRVMADVAG